MNENEVNDEQIRVSLNNLKAWLASRPQPEDNDDVAVISAPDGLKSIGFADLVVEKAQPYHQDEIVHCLDSITNKPKAWTEFAHLYAWSTEFLTVMKNNKSNLTALELMRGLNEYPISAAEFHVEEAIAVISSALSFDVGLDIQHPDTRGQNYSVTNILIEDTHCLQDIMRQIFACLYCKSVVRLVVRANHYYSTAMTVYLSDLMYQSGASKSEIRCIVFDRRESLGNEKFSKLVAPNKLSKLSIVAIIFKNTDTFAAAQGIIESYYRDHYQNLIILVEESAYERFIKDWQRYYSHAVQIGLRLDNRTTIVESFNSKVSIDLAAIDIKLSHKMLGNVINVLKFRTPAELITLLKNFRKIPHLSIWNDDVVLSREFCLRLNQCSEFWINHIPKSLAGRRFSEDMLNCYQEAVADDMTHIYNTICADYTETVDQVKKLHNNFMKMDSRSRTIILIQAFTSIVTKSKSLRTCSSTGDCVARLLRFKQRNTHKVNSLEPGDSRIESILQPVGLALLLVKEDSSIKSKAMLVEFIFKNLLIGNAVVLVCPANTLGTKFSFDNDRIVPFMMAHESLPDISKMSLNTSAETCETSIMKKQCPRSAYALEILPDMTNEIYETITLALGGRHKSVWYADAEQINFWLDECKY